MSLRVLRALSRGGFAQEVQPGRWRVWRTADCRGRPIGELEAQTIQGLIGAGRLRAIGRPATRYEWRGEPIAPGNETVSAQVLLEPSTTGRGPLQSLIYRLIVAAKDADTARLWSQVSRAFAYDFEAAASGGLSGGMNWQALSAGTRIDGAGGAAGKRTRLDIHREAKARMASIFTGLEARDQKFLIHMLVETRSRHAISTAARMRPDQAERQGRRLLLRVVHAYTNTAKVPELSAPQPA